MDGNLIGAEAEALNDEEAIAAEKAAEKAAAAAPADDEPEADAAAPAAPAAEPAAEQPAAPEEAAPAVPELTLDQPFVPPVPEVEDFDYDAERDKLLTERRDVRALLREGDISQDDADERLDKISDSLAELAARKTRNESAAQEQDAIGRAQYVWTLNQVKSHIAEKDGINYDAPENRSLLLSWDAKIKALASDPANASRPSEWFMLEAHREVRAEIDSLAERFGYKKPATPSTPKVKEAIEARKPKADVRTLANLPAAEATATGNADEFAHLDGLAGIELEAALAKMPKDAADRYLSGQ